MTWLFARELRPFVLLAAAASLALNLALLMPAIYMVQVFDRVFASRSIETLAMLTLAAGFALALGYFMDVARARALSWAGSAVDRRLSAAALDSVLREAAASPRRADTDALRDVGHLRTFLASPGVHALFDAPWLPLFLLVIALMHPMLGAVAACGAVLLVGLALLTERFTRHAAQESVRRSRVTGRHADALVRNAEVIVGMGMLRAAVGGWQSRQDDALDAQRRLATASRRLSAAARIARQALQVAMLGVGAWLVVEADASAGIMVAATILLGRALQPVEHLIAGWKAQLDARGAWQRLCERRVAGAARPTLELPAPEGRLDVENVGFAPAADRPALVKQVSFSLAAGESLGIVGPSASGKTTLVRLILGIWTPQSGTVRLDGADIAQWDRDALGAHVGYLPQDVELFAGTVAENIARLGEVDSERVVAAAQLARAHELILRLPEGYETQIGEGGAVLSGGQRQRIALARALYGAPRCVVLDEPNANLDGDGELALKAALKQLKAEGVTVILVGHRPALMSQLDKIAVLKDGALDAFGPAAEILSQLRAAAAPRRLAAVNPIVHSNTSGALA